MALNYTPIEDIIKTLDSQAEKDFKTLTAYEVLWIIKEFTNKDGVLVKWRFEMDKIDLKNLTTIHKKNPNIFDIDGQGAWISNQKLVKLIEGFLNN